MLKRLVIMLGVLVAALTVVAPSGMCDDVWNRKTTVTISEPLELPGVTLQPGTYIFKLADSLSNRHIVQVFNEDESHIIATVMAIPNWRLEPRLTGRTELDLWETPAGAPKALRAWFYPGDSFGQEFPPPPAQPVPQTAQVREQVPPPPAPAPAPQPSVTETTPNNPQPEEQPRTEPAPQTQAPPAATQPEQRTELPHTASLLPLIGLTGLLALGAAVTIRFSRLS